MRYRRIVTVTISILICFSALVINIPQDTDADWTNGPLNTTTTHYVNVTGYPAGGKVIVTGLMIGGDLAVKVTGISAKGNLEVQVMNNQVGGKISVVVDGNPFLYDLHVLVGGNKAGSDIYISTSSNAVSNLWYMISENQACNRFECKVFANTIDYKLFANIQHNKASKNMFIDISANHKPTGWPQLFTLMHVYLEDNHVVDQDLEVHIMINTMATEGDPHMGIWIWQNGAGRDVKLLIMSNEADPTGTFEVVINDNASGKDMNITIQGNKANIIKITVVRNYACFYIRLSLQAAKPGPPILNNNKKKCMQKTGGDSDSDGLSDKYETMVGTDPNHKDTDGDGLLDGWDDTNGNKKWEMGERYGEIGDPQGRYFHGSIRYLAPMDHAPRALCVDIYVEIDYLRGTKMIPNSAVKLVEKEFERHRIKLHVDTGWSKTVKSDGGQKLKHDCTKMWNNRYLYLGPSAKRRIAHPKNKNNDFYDFKTDPNCFSPTRKDIFHYCIIADYLSTYRSSLPPPNIRYSNSTLGLSERLNGGDDLTLAEEVIKDEINYRYNNAQDRKKNGHRIWADTFMHELGHNLQLDDTNATADETKTVMYAYSSPRVPLNYKEPAEWSAIKPQNVVDPID